MKQSELNYKNGVVPYFHTGDDPKDPEQTHGYKKYEFEMYQHGIWGYIIEAFAAHCHHLANGIDLNPEKPLDIAIAEGHRVLEAGDKLFLCIPDNSFDEVSHLGRSNAEDIASLNWYAYTAAKESILECVETTTESRYKAKRRAQAQIAIADYEWRNIKTILKHVHLFNYPRPSHDRTGYLANCGIKNLPLVLS